MYKNFTKKLGNPPGYAYKLLLVMKLIIVLCLTTVLQTFAATTYGQRITLSGKNISISQVFRQIRQQSGYDFLYNRDLLAEVKVSVQLNNASIDEALEASLKGLNLTYKINDKIIYLQRALRSSVQQDSVITGKVIDALTKQPIPGVTVANPDDRKYTQSNGQGVFRINGKSGTLLSFSYIGYKERSITIKSAAAVLTISLEESVNEMKDVVINGIFSRKAETATGSQTIIPREKLLEAGTVNIIQSLRNIDPSFSIVENSAAGSNPNALPDINIRGQSGLPDLNGDYATNPNLPLFILDGFETTLRTIIDLDMYRVASVTILKDAASKAIYGAKAANGVVVVETVRPLPGQIRVNYNSSMGFSMPDLSSYNMANASQKLQAEVAAGLYTSTIPADQVTLMRQYNTYLSNIERGVETNWMSKPLQNALTQRHSLAFQGGDERFIYNATLNYNGENGVMKGSAANTLGGNLDLNYRTSKFNIRNNLTVSSRKGTESPWGSFSSYVNMNPYLPYTDENGQIVQVSVLRDMFDVNPSNGRDGMLTNGVRIYNPAYNATLASFDQTKNTTFINNTSLEWIVSPSFRTNARFSLTRVVGEGDVYLSAGDNSFLAEPNANLKGSYRKSNSTNNRYDGQLNLVYSKLIQKHAITANGGATITENETYGTGFITQGFTNDRLAFPTLGVQYQVDSRPSGSESLVRDMGFYASANYSYDQRYNADLTYRTNQSSQYGSNNRWGQFWSAGLSWNLHNEAFIRAIGFINSLRLRGSTGFTGSQGFDSYLGLGTYRYEALKYMSANGATLMALANPDLRWQRRQDHNFGVDFSFLRKFTMRGDYNIAYTDGLLTDITLPLSTGFSAYKANLGKVKNRTLEIFLNYNVFQNSAKRRSLSFFASVSQNRDKLLEISNSLRSFNARQNALSAAQIRPFEPAATGANAASNNYLTRVANYRAELLKATLPKPNYVEGQSMNAIWAVPSLGIDPATGKERYRKLDGSTTYEWDINDQVVVGNSRPDWQGNFGFNFQYSGFRANATFRAEFGGQLYNTTLLSRVENANIYDNIDLRVLEGRWQKPGDVAYFKSIKDRAATRVSSRFVEDNNRLTMASLQLGYDLDRIASIKKLGFTQLRASITSSELFEISSMQIERGTDFPFARTVQLTLNANF